MQRFFVASTAKEALEAAKRLSKLFRGRVPAAVSDDRTGPRISVPLSNLGILPGWEF